MSDEYGGPVQNRDVMPVGPPSEATQRAKRRLIVKLDPQRYAEEGALERQATAIASGIDGAEVERVSRTGRVLLNLSDDMDPASVAEEVSRREEVVYAEPDVVDRAVDDSDS